MKELTWKNAIIKVLEEEKKALHYTEIAELIAEKNYRKNFGATPQDTVSAQMTTDINQKGEKSVFAKVDRGIYILRKFLKNESQKILQNIEDKVESSKSQKENKFKIINSFGVYWDRNLVFWESTIPDLFSVQQKGAETINFKDQIGIYLLHDSRETIYVGQAIKQSLSKRLKDHTTDRLSGRWDRFSWFGFYPVDKNGKLITNIEFDNILVEHFGDLLEAILIESIEPRQNRRQGNLFNGIEYLQQEAPELKEKKMKQTLQALTEKFYK
jgi:hypothetical protein